MSWVHAGCRDAKCKGPNGCFFRGPQGQFCYFDPNQKLAEVLGIEWAGQTLDELITLVRDRLQSKEEETDYSRAVRIAQAQQEVMTKPTPALGAPYHERLAGNPDTDLKP